MILSCYSLGGEPDLDHYSVETLSGRWLVLSWKVLFMVWTMESLGDFPRFYLMRWLLALISPAILEVISSIIFWKLA